MKKISRRKFFFYFFLTTGGVILTLGLKSLGALAGIFSIDRNFLNNKKLTNIEKHTLPSLYESMTGENNPEKISSAITFMANFLGGLEVERRRELNLGLIILNILPFFYLFSFKSFYQLNREDRVVFLKKISTGPLILYPLFGGLKELCFLTYYRLDENFEKINYNGPVVDGMNPDFENEEYYKSFLAAF